MMPDALTLVVLILAAYRLTRLAGWDDFPLAAKVRGWVIGERWVTAEPIGRIDSFEQTDEGMVVHGPLTRQGVSLDLPGKQPSSEVDAVRPAYDRPTLAHLVHCPFCIGWWISLATWLAWLAWHPVVYGLAAFAVSGAVGLISKNLDA